MPAPEVVQVTDTYGPFPAGAVFLCSPDRQHHRWVTSPSELDDQRLWFAANGWPWSIVPTAPDRMVRYGERIGAVP